MVGSRSTSAREPGQVRKEAALSGHRWAVRGRPAGVSEVDSPRRPTSTEGARSTFFSSWRRGRHDGSRRPRSKPAGTSAVRRLRVARVEREVAQHALARRVDVDAAASAARAGRRRSRPAGCRSTARRAGPGGGWGPRPAGSGCRRVIACRSARISACVPIERAQVVRCGRPGRARRRRRPRARRAPITAQRRRHGWSRGELQPAERAGAAEDREQRRGQQQVAAEDRQAGRGEHAERGERDEPGRDRQRGAPAHERQRRGCPPAAAPSSPGSRRISPSRRGTVSGTSSRPVLRCSTSALSRVPVSECSGSPASTSRAASRSRARRRRSGSSSSVALARPRRRTRTATPRVAAGPARREQDAATGSSRRRGRRRLAPRIAPQHERDVRDVHVRAHAEAQDRDRGSGSRARRRRPPRGRTSARRARRSASASAPSDEEREHDPERLRRRRRTASAATPSSGRQRMRGGGERDAEVRLAQMRHVAAPEQAVGRVVVEEAGADRAPTRRALRAGSASPRARRGGRAAPLDSDSPWPLRCTAVIAPARSQTWSAKSTSSARSPTRSSRTASTTRTCSSARAAPARRPWPRSWRLR